MPIILADDLLAMQLPESRVVVRAGRHQVGRVGAEGAVPDPALVAGEGRLERVWLGLRVRGGLDVLDLPYLGRVVGAARRQLLDVWGEQDARDALLVRAEMRDWHQLGAVKVLDKVPYKHVALSMSEPDSWARRLGTYGVIRGAQERAVTSDCDAGDRDVFFWDELVGTVVLGQVPDSYAARPVAADNLALVGVDHNIVHRAAVVIAPLNCPRPRLPDLDSAVLGAGHHPFSFAVESDTGDVARVALKSQQRVRVGRLDIVELDGVVARGGEVSLVG